MFSILHDCSKQLQRHLSKTVNANVAIEVHELAGSYATNVMAKAAFGIEVDCLADPNHPFRKNACKIFETNIKNAVRYFGWFFQPTLLKWFGLRFIDRKIEKYFVDLVAQILKMREEDSVVRKDFFQLLVELRNNDSRSLDDKQKSLNENKKVNH